ncbi:MAG TPA: tetratricopeptide repeat protein [Candidatus Acidoferrum sp.]|nr:tetratricopeptide repeat protein [Candidatus Acidoferrum sp.]
MTLPFKLPRCRKEAAISVLLFLLVVGVFLPSIQNGFIDVDDAGYISQNVHVCQGFSWDGLGWAFTNVVGGSWHPLTWLSIMLDCQLFGTRPAGHHAIDLLLHALNTVLLFLALQRMTGASGRSAFVAALFGVHPLHVESVAWAAERKDTLSTLFWMLTLLTYARYTELSKAQSPRAARFYRFTLLFFVCGLMSKPMLVTLPLVLLLLDWWPLGRGFSPALFREKQPFLLLGLAVGVLTLFSQEEVGALSPLTDLGFRARVVNAILSYLRYLAQMAWPLRLALFYPLPRAFPIWPAAGVVLLLVALSLLALWTSRTRPYLAVGWLWYLVTLLPVIGLIQVGQQSHADRYTYIPSIGVFTLLVWGIHDLTRGWRFQRLVLSALGLAIALPCIALTRRQLRYWKDSQALFSHALTVTQDNVLAHDILGSLLVREGRLDEGIPHLEVALKLAPSYARVHNDLGAALGKKGHDDQAMAQFQEALQLDPKLADAHRNLALALEKQGRLDEAIGQLRLAVALKPEFPEAHRNLGIMLGKQGRLPEAAASLGEAVRLAPADAEAQCSLGITLGKLGRLDEALEHLEAAVHLNPGSAEAQCNLGVALGAKGRLDEAINHLQAALKLKPGYADAQNNLRTALDARGGATADRLSRP